jgi:hypothetical protein
MLEGNSQLQSLIFEEKKLIKQVWSKDDVSPASFLYSYKDSNILFEWNPISMTRLYKGGECLEVLVHQDGSLFYVKEFGNFVAHLESN